MPGTRVENSPSFADRKRDITSWQEGDISDLSTREKKRYQKRKSAVIAYFTSETAFEQIIMQHHLSARILLKLTVKCTQRHQDGDLWGFRALLPGARVVDFVPAAPPGTPEAAGVVENQEEEPQSHDLPAAHQTSLLVEDAREDPAHDTAKRETITHADQSAAFAAHAPGIPEVPETPYPLFADAEDEATLFAEEYAAAVTEGSVVQEAEQPLVEEPEGNEEDSLPASTLELTATEAPIEKEDEAQEPTAKLIEQPPVAARNVIEPLASSLSLEAEEVTGSLTDQTAAELAEAAETEGDEAASAAATDETTFQAAEPGQGSHEAEDAIAEAQRIMVTREEGSGEEEDPAGQEAEEDELAPLRCGSRAVGMAVVEVAPLIIPAAPSRHTYVGTKRAQQRRLVRKRWQRDVQGHTHNRQALRIVSLAAVIAMLLFVLVPVGAGMAAYGAYTNLSGIAHDGVNHLLRVKSLLNVSKTDFTSALDAARLQPAQSEFRAAESDFAQLQQLVNRPDVQGVISQFAPQYSNKLSMAQSLAQAAMDVSRMGDELSGIALIGANVLHASPLASSSTKPLLSTADVEAIDGAMVHALYYISDIRAQLSNVSIKDLPVSDAQKKQIASLLPLLPKAQDMIVQAQGLVGLVTWLLGVGHPRRYLIQTMDRAELRPGGGFTGQYGIVQVQDGRTSPLSLKDVTPLDYAENGTAIGRTAPPGYSWMNFGNWGVRDSNLSGDFPTTARMTMQLFSDEGGGPLDGDIAFTPIMIGNILDIVGPIKVPGYNETITSKNLESLIHTYQQDPNAIAREQQISGNFTHTGRKAFTSTLAKMLLDRVRHLKPKALLAVVKSAVKSIQSRDLEIYFANPAAEAWLVRNGYSASIDTFSQQDGFMLVQANISISKASQYVHTTEHDDVTLDASGGATHNLTITLDYQQLGPVYGFDTYADYIRVYAPASAQLLGGDGFDTGHALCTPTTVKSTKRGSVEVPTAGCGQYNSYFHGSSRYCPSGNYSLGLRGGFNTGWPVDSLGSPTARSSDLPGRAMFGGLTETPKNCISTITVSWYVPHAVRNVNGQPVYPFLVQKQSGLSPTIELNINASAYKGLPSFKFSGIISTDKAFTLLPPAKKK